MQSTERFRPKISDVAVLPSLPRSFTQSAFGLGLLAVWFLSATSLIAQQRELTSRPRTAPPQSETNPYSKPSLDRLFQALEELKPFPSDLFKPNFREPVAVSREQIALTLGRILADGILIAQVGKRNAAGELERTFLRLARTMGTSDEALRRAATLSRLGQRGDWTAFRRELAATHNDLEEAMLASEKENLVSLIRLGAWLRALEISAAAVERNFTSQRAQILWQPDVVNYFSHELENSAPSPEAATLWADLPPAFATIKTTINVRQPDDLTLAVVRLLHQQARELNLLIQRGG